MSVSQTISQMRMRVSLEAPLDTPDDSGALTRAWLVKAAIWAQIKPMRGEEQFLSGEQQTMITHEVTIRWRSDIATPMRLVFAGRIFMIESAFDPDGRKRVLVCRCVEFVA